MIPQSYWWIPTQLLELDQLKFQIYAMANEFCFNYITDALSQSILRQIMSTNTSMYAC